MKMVRAEKKVIVAWILLVISFLIAGPAISKDEFSLFFVGLFFFIAAFIILFSITKDDSVK